MVFWIYFKDISTINKLSSIYLYIYDSAGNWDRFDILNNPENWEIIPPKAKPGWQAVKIYIGQYDKRYFPVYNYHSSSATKPDTTSITKIRLEFNTIDASVTINEGEIVIDYFHYGTKITVNAGTPDAPLDFDEVYVYDVNNALGVIDKQWERNYRVFCWLSGSYLFFDRGALTIEKNFRFDPWIRIENSFVFHKYSDYDFNPDGKISKSRVFAGGYLGYIRANLEEVTAKATYILVSYPNEIRNSNLQADIDFSVRNVYDSIISLVRLLNLAGGELRNTKIINSGTGAIIIYSGADNSITYFRNVEIVGSYVYSFYRTGKIYWQYSFDLKLVDFDGNPIQNANVSLYDKNNNLIFSELTDVDGKISTKWVTSELIEFISSTNISRTDYNPFRLLITKDGQKIVDYKLEIRKPINAVISTHNLYSLVPSTNKSGYQKGENVLIYARVFDWNNKPVTGLTVNAVITKPDGSKITISLRDDGVYPDEIAGDGVYTGVTSTDLVGTYEVEISSSIYGNQVKAKTYFDVGIIEKKLDGIDKKLDDIDKEIKTPKAKFF